MRGVWVVLVLLGSVGILGAGALYLIGSAEVWSVVTDRDGGGFFVVSPKRFQTSTYALTSPRPDLGVSDETTWFFYSEDVSAVRLRVASKPQGQKVFIGIGERHRVEAYLAQSAHDEIADVGLEPFYADYRGQDGELPPAPPARQSFWAASASGSGFQTLTWDVEPGSWTVVIMNNDASRGVDADVSVGAKAYDPWFTIAGGLVIGWILAGGSAVMFVVGIASLQRPSGSASSRRLPLGHANAVDPVVQPLEPERGHADVPGDDLPPADRIPDGYEERSDLRHRWDEPP